MYNVQVSHGGSFDEQKSTLMAELGVLTINTVDDLSKFHCSDVSFFYSNNLLSSNFVIGQRRETSEIIQSSLRQISNAAIKCAGCVCGLL